jgi:hypothetical protein
MHNGLAAELLIGSEELAAAQAKALAGKQAKRQTRTAGHQLGFFIVPAAWAAALDRTRHPATRNIAWGLLRMAGGAYRGQELYLPADIARRTGVSRVARRAALRELEALELVEIRAERTGQPFAIVLREMV